MNYLNIFIIALALIVGVIEYWTKRISLKHNHYSHNIVSFSAGVSITYLLLELFPLFTEAAFQISRLLFIPLLIGFIAHHLVEKEIYMHNKKHELIKKLTLEENLFYFIYHLILGIMLVTFTRQGILQGVFLAISILSYTLVSNLPAVRHKSWKRALFLSTSTLLGTLFHLFIWQNIPIWIEFMLIGFAIGVLLFTVTRHHIPFGRMGRIGAFSLGFLFYAMLIILSWFI